MVNLAMCKIQRPPPVALGKRNSFERKPKKRYKACITCHNICALAFDRRISKMCSYVMYALLEIMITLTFKSAELSVQLLQLILI